MKRIIINFVPHSEQRYDTCGDWQIEAPPDEDCLVIKVSNTEDWRSSALVAIHELVEAILCIDAGITPQAVDDFDMSWKPSYKCSEPGDHPNAPYRNQHKIATKVERIVAAELKFSWREHGRQLDALSGIVEEE